MGVQGLSKPIQPQAPAANAVAPPPVRKLRKQEILFAEGENSRAMYYVKVGLIRIFKKKGKANVEIDTIHSGQVLGELAFLDGQPRSASAEALTECQLIEISGETFTQTLARMPDWLKILLKTVVGRLRTASNRIRQLESVSTTYTYNERDGRSTSQYVYLSPPDVLKVFSALLLVASRNGEKVANGIQIRMGLLQRYGNQIMQVPVAKISTLLDVLGQVGAVSIDAEKGMSEVIVTDLDFIEKGLAYLNEQNLLEPTKRSDLTLKGFMIMSMMAKHMSRFPTDAASGTATVNLVEVRKLETGPSGKDPFRMDDFPELIKLGYASNLNVKSAEEILTTVKTDAFFLSYRLQRLSKSIEAANEQKGVGP